MEKTLHHSPLADRMRPQTLADFVGQEKVIGQGTLLRQAIETDQLPSLIFWGPPGCGKTTLAHVIANSTKADFIQISAVSSGKKDLLLIIKKAQENSRLNLKTILFIDEIHRWNKTQQDALLPHVERGTIILIGATTENPSFEVRGALLSRCRTLVFDKFTDDDIIKVVERSLTDKDQGYGAEKIKIEEEVLKKLAQLSNGDVRTALNVLEYVVMTSSAKKIKITEDLIKEAFQKSHLMYDKDGEEHYNIISALHKSMRGSDANAALYWLVRMLEGGEDPLYVARRLVRFASEDVGLANSRALEQAVAAYQACHFLGMPECNVILAQAVVYLAKCEKSNALYVAYGQAKRDVDELGNLPVPLHIRNAPTKLMKDLGYGKDYKYSPNFDYKEDQEYLPDELKKRKYLSN